MLLENDMDSSLSELTGVIDVFGRQPLSVKSRVHSGFMMMVM